MQTLEFSVRYEVQDCTRFLARKDRFPNQDIVLQDLCKFKFLPDSYICHYVNFTIYNIRSYTYASLVLHWAYQNQV